MNVGDTLPEVAIDVTATLIVSAALASRDFKPLHHDKAAANASGMRDIFVNILASNGLVVKYVTDWAGPEAIVKRSSIRLGVPHYAGETLRLSGEVAAVDGAGNVDVKVRGRNQMGDHVSGTITVNLP